MARVQLIAAGMLGASGLVVGPPKAAMAGRMPASAAACTTIAALSRRIELPDGRIVSIDVQSVARSGTSILAVGRYAYVFPRSANARTSPGMVDSIVGVLIDGDGRVTLVPNPATPRTVLYARAVAGPDDDFSVLYATSAPEGLRSHTDTATLWLASLRHGVWGRSSRIASVRTASLDRASALLQAGEALAFIYPFRDDRRHDEDGGAVLVRQRRGTWMFDTLRTDTEPTSISAIYDPVRGSVVAILPVADHRPPLLAQRLLMVRFDSSWSEPEAIAGDGLMPVVHPSLVMQGRTVVAAWLTWPLREPGNGSLRWLLVDTTGQRHLRPVIDSGAATFPFELTTVNGAPLWLYHGEPFGRAVKLMMATGSIVTRLPDVGAEFWNPSTKTIALSGSRVLVFTQRRAQTETEPMAASFTTALEIRCPTPVQR